MSQADDNTVSKSWAIDEALKTVDAIAAAVRAAGAEGEARGFVAVAAVGRLVGDCRRTARMVAPRHEFDVARAMLAGAARLLEDAQRVEDAVGPDACHGAVADLAGADPEQVQANIRERRGRR